MLHQDCNRNSDNAITKNGKALNKIVFFYLSDIISPDNATDHFKDQSSNLKHAEIGTSLLICNEVFERSLALQLHGTNYKQSKQSVSYSKPRRLSHAFCLHLPRSGTARP